MHVASSCFTINNTNINILLSQKKINTNGLDTSCKLMKFSAKIEDSHNRTKHA